MPRLVSQQMAHLCPLGFEIPRVVRVGFAPNRNLFDHLNSVAFEADDLLWVIGLEPELADAEIVEDLRA